MPREVVVDANVIVAWLDNADALAPRARELMERLRTDGAEALAEQIWDPDRLSQSARAE